jgi:hypothetical protein
MIQYTCVQIPFVYNMWHVTQHTDNKKLLQSLFGSFMDISNINIRLLMKICTVCCGDVQRSIRDRDPTEMNSLQRLELRHDERSGVQSGTEFIYS